MAALLVRRALLVAKATAKKSRGSSSSGYPVKFLNTDTEKSSSSVSDALVVKLLNQSNSGIKTALDLEANSTLKNEDVWEPFLTKLRYFSSHKSQLVLEWKLEKLLEENERDEDRYCELISLCEKVQNVPFALQVFTSMEAHGVRPGSAVFNSLIFACLSSGDVTTALSLFEILERLEDCKPNLVTYNVFISMYSKLGDAKAVQAWYSASKTGGHSPNIQTYESIISGFVKMKNIDVANKYYEEMVLSGVTPNVSILGSMLNGLCEAKKLVKVKEFLKFIVDGGWKMNAGMAMKVVGLYFELGRVEEMEDLLVALTRTNQDLKILSQVHCGIVRMYALSDRLDDMEFCVGRMLKQGMTFTCADDVEKVICSYFRRAAYERLDMFLERIRGSYKLTISTYNLLIAGYRRGGLARRLDLIMEEMKLCGLCTPT